MKHRLQDTYLYVCFPVLILVGSVLATVIITNIYLELSYSDKIYPNISIDSVRVGGYTKSNASSTLKELPIKNSTITIAHEHQSLSIENTDLGVSRDIDESITKAYQTGRDVNPFEKTILFVQSFFKPVHVTSPLVFEEERVLDFVTKADEQFSQKGRVPVATIEGTGTQKTVVISRGEVGFEIDQDEAVEQIMARADQVNPTLPIPMKKTGQVLSEQELQTAQERANSLLNDQIILTADTDKVTLTDATLVSLLTFPDGVSVFAIEAVLEEYRESFERVPQNAEFEYDPTTLQVTTFVPHLEGREIDTDDTVLKIITAIEVLENGEISRQEVPLVLETAQPDKTLASTNDLGIRERIGFGDSHYAGSIPTRIHNVATASKILNLTIVKPGEQFSFNQEIGEISRRTGFQPAYIISGGQTVLGDGGGVCQVSTTLFRALLDSGLNITRRKQHSYRVGYYEQDQEPGFDAAVFSGETDIRFTNDTAQHVLLVFSANSDTQYMTVEIYGTSDGRTTEIVDYQKWGARPAASTVYIDDPTLPLGKLIQIDWAVGGIRTKFTHITRDKDGNIIRETEYASNYVPWSAKYRRGTGV